MICGFQVTDLQQHRELHQDTICGGLRTGQSVLKFGFIAVPSVRQEILPLPPMLPLRSNVELNTQCGCHNGRTIISVRRVGRHHDMFNLRLLPFCVKATAFLIF